MRPIVIHAKYSNGPTWHKRYANALFDGFRKHGYNIDNLAVTNGDSSFAYDDAAVHVLFGPNYFPITFSRSTEDDIITINRCFYGDHNDNVAVGWGGFNGLARFPAAIEGRLEKEIEKFPARTWRMPKKEHIALIIGEYVSACDDPEAIMEFYAASVEDAKANGYLPVFRPHPQQKSRRIEGAAWAPNGNILGATVVYTYASTYGVHARLIGAPVIADEASLAHADGEETEKQWLARVAAAQWHIDELQSGEFWEYLKGA